MKRREFITLLGGAAAAWPLMARAQQTAKLPTIGFLGASSASAQAQWTAAFLQRLRELGWIEGRTIAIEYRWAEGRNDRFAEFATEFVGLKVDVIVTDGGAAVAAKKVTSVIPIVFAVSADPLGTGLVANLARPGGNVTGSTVQAPDLAGKRLGLLREALPGLHRLAILVNAGYPAAVLETGEVEAAARTLGIEAIRAEIRRAEDFAPAIDGVKGRADALYVCTDSFANSNRVLINTSALEARLPTMHGIRTLAEAGGLMSYGANFPDLFRRAGEFVDKILRGAKPSDLPVEQPIKFDLVINLKTAKALGLTVPPTLLARADEVIE
jgi:putative ABC transport system substrate-binding protein